MIRDRFISPQVQMVLTRMETHPDEFVARPAPSLWTQPRWQPILEHGGFNHLERFLLKRKYNKLKREATQQRIMDAILKSEPVEEEFGPTMTIPSRSQRAVQTLIDLREDDNYIRF